MMLSGKALLRSAPEQGTSLIRSLIWYGALWMVGKHWLPLDLAAPATLLVTQAWSSVEKFLIRKHAIKRQIAALQLLPLPAARKAKTMSDTIFSHLQSLASKVGAWVENHPLDDAAKKDLEDLLNEFANEGDSLAKAEVAKLPASMAAAGMPLDGLIDQAKMAIQAEADAKINALDTAKISIPS